MGMKRGWMKRGWKELTKEMWKRSMIAVDGCYVDVPTTTTILQHNLPQDPT